MEPENPVDRAGEFALALLRDEIVDLDQAALQLAEAALDDPELARIVAPFLRANGDQLVQLTRSMLLAMQETFATGSTTAFVEWVRRSEAEMFTLLGDDVAARVLVTQMTAELDPVIKMLDEAFTEARVREVELPDFLDLIAEPVDEDLVLGASPIESFINQMVAELNTALPVHWPPEHILQLVEMVVDAQVPIISGAPTPVVLDCLAAWKRGADPWQEIADHHDEILSTLRSDVSAGGAVTDDRVVALLDVIELALDGKWRGTICGAMPIIDSFIYKRRFGSYRNAHSASVRSSHEVPVGSLRATLVLHCVAPIYAGFDVVADDPPDRLNRHAVVHTVSRAQFTKANALRTVLLAANTFELGADS